MVLRYPELDFKKLVSDLAEGCLVKNYLHTETNYSCKISGIEFKEVVIRFGRGLLVEKLYAY